jgi:hypothetical protein
MIAALLMMLSLGSVSAEEPIKATTKVKHKPAKYFVPEKRIKLDATVKDAAGVAVVRCYFRAVEHADYVFVAMEATKKDIYEGVLPAPSKDTEIIEYLFLAVNGENHVVKTQTFEMHKKDDDKVPVWQQVSSEGDIMVSTELAYAPTAPPGFTDSIAMNVVESSARFGFVVGGIYGADKVAAAGGASGAAAGSSSAGLVTASAGAGLGTASLVALGAVAVGGAVAASSSSGDDDSPGGVAASGGTEGVCSNYEGTYTGSHTGFDCNEAVDDGTDIIELSADCTYRLIDNVGDVSTGRLVVSGNSFSSADDNSEYCGGLSFSGTFEESGETIRMTGNWSYALGGGGLFDLFRQ